MSLKLETFKDIVDAISEAIGVQKDDLNARNKIKRLVNMYYIDEVIAYKRWFWLQKNTSVVHEAYYGTGTAIVTPDSVEVTLNTAPNVSEGSFARYKFSVDGSNKVYTVDAHTAGSGTVTLTGKYQEALNETANFKLWRDVVDLPTDAKETVEIWHAEQSRPVKGVGPQELRKFEAADPKREGFPVAYNTTDYFDPSSADDEYESDRFRQVRVYPAITQTPVTLNIDYIQDVTEMVDDADEPVLPVTDRIVIYYGAGAQAWSLISRNEDMHDRWYMKAEAKLKRMAGETQDGFDSPALSPKSSYVNNIRRSGLKRVGKAAGVSGGQSSVALPSYLKDVRIDGATLIDDMEVDDGVLIDGRDISEDGIVLDNLAAATPVALTDSASGQVIASFALASKDTIHLQYSIKRDTNREAGIITMITDGTDVSIAQGAISELGDCGVTVTADVSGGNVRLIAATSSTGFAATFTYRQFSWNS